MSTELSSQASNPTRVDRRLPDWLSALTEEARKRRRREGISENTLRAMQTAARIFEAWCCERNLDWLPASPESVALFLEDYAAEGAKLSTVKARLAGINAIHRAKGLMAPGHSEIVKEALRALSRKLGASQTQAAPLNGSAIAVILSHIDVEAKKADQTSLSGKRSFETAQRDAALIALAYDTFARRSELSEFDIADIERDSDGSGSIRIKRSKTDQDGEGAQAYVSADTMGRIDTWAMCAEICDGPLFISIGPNASGDRLKSGDIARIMKRRADAAGLENADKISGHSARVGASQDAVAAGIDILAIQQAGRWKSARMPARYGERLSVKRGAASKLAALQGRN